MARIGDKLFASEDVLPAVIGGTLQGVSSNGRGLELTLTVHEEELLAGAAKGYNVPIETYILIMLGDAVRAATGVNIGVAECGYNSKTRVFYTAK